MASITAIEYGPDFRNGYRFGLGQDCEARPTDNTPDAIVQRALELGWSNGCPRAMYYVMESPYGADWMMNRYAETNLWFAKIVNLVHFRFKNPKLFDWISLTKPRLIDEPMGIHEPLSVPESHKRIIAPMSGIEGYSAPRILLELKAGADRARVEALQQAVILTGLEPSNFLAHLAQIAVNMGVQPERVLHHVYAQGVLDEENCRRSYVDLAQTLEQHAPDVWQIYFNLHTNQRQELEIAEIPLAQLNHQSSSKHNSH